MKKRSLKPALLAGLVILLTMIAASALAAAPVIRFCWTAEGKEISVKLYEKKNQNLYLFLPGALAGQDPVLRIDWDADLKLDGEVFKNGESFTAEQFVGRTVQASLTTGRRLGTIQVMRGSAIPSLFFTIEEADFKRVNQGTRFDIREAADLVMLAGDGSVEASEKITSFKTHGNSTFYATKKPFQFKMEHKAALGGMDKNKKWILLANWFDISLVRNQISFDLCREIGLSSTPDCRQTDLYVNGAYLGTYLLTEKIQMKKGRLEITDLEEILEELNGKEAYDSAAYKRANRQATPLLKWFDLAKEPEDITGGYLLEIEKNLQFTQNNSEAGFVTDRGMCVLIKEPTHVGYRGANYIAGLVNDFHNAVLRKDGTSKETGIYYAKYIDMRSFALKITMEEFNCNYDVRAASQYLYKDSDRVDSRLYAGPAWDYDLSYGNKDDGQRNPLKEDYVYKRSSDEVYLYHWLLTHEDFRMITRQLYDEVFLPAAEVLAGRREPTEGSPLKSVAAYQDEIRDSAAMNFSRYSARAIPDVWDGSGRTFEDAGAFVRKWIDQRLDMMTQKWLLEDKK